MCKSIQHYLGVCARVKRLCKARLRFTRSLRNSRGEECRGEFWGESQGDILGDWQGEPDMDCGFSRMGWGLLCGKESASPGLCQRASLMLLRRKFNRIVPGAALSLRTGGSGRPSHSSRILHETTLRSILQRCVLDSETLVGVFQVSGSSSFEKQQSYLYQQLMDTDTSAGVSPPLSSKLCLHSSEPCLNMARPEL